MIPKQHVWVKYPDDTEKPGVLLRHLGDLWLVRISTSGVVWVGAVDHLRKRDY